MSRSHAHIVTKIWTKQDWRNLNAGAQWLYFLILTQPDLTNAGVVSFNPTRWAKQGAGVTADDIEQLAKELADARFVVLDDFTCELMVRTFIRNDNVAKQPKLLMSALKNAMAVSSPVIREELSFELSKIVGLEYPPAVKLLAETVEELTPGGAPSQSPTLSSKGFIPEAETLNRLSATPNGAGLESPRKKGLIGLPETPWGGGGGYCSSNLKVKDAREENPGQADPSDERTSPSNDSFNESKDGNDAFTRFCEALPKPPRTALAQVRMKWQAACVEHQGWRVLEAAKAYGKKFESGPDGTKYAKQAIAFLDSDEFTECLPHPMQAYRGMDLEKWLDMVTEQRDTGTVYRYAGGETFFPRLPDNYLKLSDAEKATEMAIAKDAWFREHRDEHLKNLRIRYGVITDVA